MNKRKQQRKAAKEGKSDASSSSTASSSSVSSSSSSSPASSSSSSSSSPSPSSDALLSSVASLKEEGNAHYSAGNFDAAISSFSRALSLPSLPPSLSSPLLSNRSAAYFQLSRFQEALQDAEEVVKQQPQWSKGYLRKGQALEALGRYIEAREAYGEGGKRGGEGGEGEAQLKKALAEVTEVINELKLEAPGGGPREKDKYEQMSDWLRAGGARFPSLYLRHYDEDWRGVHALTRVPVDSIILEVPLALIMTSEVAKASAIGREITASGCDLASSHSFLACFLCEERKNEASYWAPYIRCLPQHYRNMPINFNERELSLLQGSFSVRKIIDRQEELKEEYDNICRHVPRFSDHPLEAFIWARQVVITRIFGLVIGGAKTDGLVPFADMLNHKRPRETSWQYEEERGAFTITTLKGMARGEQVYDSYGRKCNSRFFVNYGFSLEENEDNQAVMWFSIPPSDPSFSVKMRLMGGMRGGMQKHRFQIPIEYKNEKVTRECFSFLRFAHARDKELLLLQSSSSSSSFDIKEIEPLSLRNELAVLRSLRQAAEAALREYATSLEEDNALLKDEALLPPFSNERNAVLMRRGEKEVLHYYVDLEKEVERLVDMPWKDFKKVAMKSYAETGKFDQYIHVVMVPLMKGNKQ